MRSAIQKIARRDPQRLLPRIDQIAAKAHHVREPRRDGDDRKHDVGQVPCLVTELELRAPQGRDDQRDQRVDRESAKGGAPRRFEEIEHGQPLRPQREKDEDVQDDKGDCDQRYLAVKVINDVFAPWLGDVPEARGETELQTHHRQARVADCDGELPPEIARRRERPRQQREQRGKNEEQVNGDPEGCRGESSEAAWIDPIRAITPQ